MTGDARRARTARPGPPGPPAFTEAQSKRARVRAAGMDPDYWYAVAHESELPRGKTLATRFWGHPIVVYRGADGTLHALEDRCAHRQLKLSGGEVNGCHLTCTYHGWSYDGDGNVVHYAHDLFGRARPEAKVAGYPVTSRHGLIWIFPGEPALAPVRTIPAIPELSGRRPWARLDASFTWQAHHSMIIDNVSDFTHSYLHRRFRPFWDAKLTRHELIGDRVELSYATHVGGGRLTSRFVDRRQVDTTSIELAFDYPYQRSDTGGSIKHWCFVLPMDRRTSRVFFIFYFDAVRIPGTRWTVPRRLLPLFMRVAGALVVKPLLGEDGEAVESEQLGYETHYAAPILELNPAVGLFQDLTIRKWEEFLDRDRARPRPSGIATADGRVVPSRHDSRHDR
ncbi:aromatic ring-hydroxylating oxygenase subunit alpha [Streptomyces syringium]|uniref:Phenylpropionate dioxygenase-like ring-hydroxylating dioxygenase large terminal subunit n=1 Tax=Streptomyces syringium TaxID=76729 RepID=A0ABS4XWQ9_9ACTN|nr:aromatic ring-hydroxylating dioxygenase subunit alpha [Streptomyces syringium]MBP2400927.1 phenylpropionate dioxygenase-like ring-hydroxylating dioxygenase large terminal subunit [Streptomyces syringium]